jgi:hypothetical protein
MSRLSLCHSPLAFRLGITMACDPPGFANMIEQFD